MNADELIAKLQSCPPKTEVVIPATDGCSTWFHIEEVKLLQFQSGNVIELVIGGAA